MRDRRTRCASGIRAAMGKRREPGQLAARWYTGCCWAHRDANGRRSRGAPMPTRFVSAVRLPESALALPIATVAATAYCYRRPEQRMSNGDLGHAALPCARLCTCAVTHGGQPVRPGMKIQAREHRSGTAVRSSPTAFSPCTILPFDGSPTRHRELHQRLCEQTQTQTQNSINCVHTPKQISMCVWNGQDRFMMKSGRRRVIVLVTVFFFSPLQTRDSSTRAPR